MEAIAFRSVEFSSFFFGKGEGPLARPPPPHLSTLPLFISNLGSAILFPCSHVGRRKCPILPFDFEKVVSAEVSLTILYRTATNLESGIEGLNLQLTMSGNLLNLLSLPLGCEGGHYRRQVVHFPYPLTDPNEAAFIQQLITLQLLRTLILVLWALLRQGM